MVRMCFPLHSVGAGRVDRLATETAGPGPALATVAAEVTSSRDVPLAGLR
ncbi:hypothetical protein GCM10010398_57160 [Streptomyces fimbriatus]